MIALRTEEADRLSYFTAEKAKAQALRMRIDKTDTEIDAPVPAVLVDGGGDSRGGGETMST